MQKPQDSDGHKLQGTSNRGLAYWTDGSGRRLLSIRGPYLFALNPENGEPYAGFGEQGKVDLTPGLGPLLTRFSWGSPPLIVRDVIVDRGVASRSGPPRPEGRRAGGRARVRRAHRPAPLDISCHPA